MLIPYWQLAPDDINRLAMAIHHQIAIDSETGITLSQGRQCDRYWVTIPAPSSKLRDNTYLRFQAASDREAYAKAQARIAKYYAMVKQPR